MRSSGEKSQKPAEQAKKPRSRKAKLEPVSHDTAENIKTQDGLKNLARSIMENVHIAIALIDRNHKILMVNNAMSKSFCKPAIELIGRDCFREFEKRESVCPHCPGKRAMETGQPAEAETEGIRDDGSHFSVRIQAFPTIEADGTVTGFIEIVEDITEQKHAEQALRESEQKYKDIFENAQEAIVTVDLDGRITEVNKLVEEYGFKKEELIGKKLFDFIPEYDKARSVSDFEILVGGNPVNGEMDVITPKGIFTVEYRDNPIVRAGKVIGVQIILTDITERKNAEQELRKSKNLLEKIFISLDSAIFLLDCASPPTIMDCNPAAVKIFGYEKHQMLGITTEFLHVNKDTLLEFQRALFPAIEEQGSLTNFEFRMKRKNGQVFATEHSVLPLKDDKGNRTGWVSVVRDITERKRAEQLLRKERDKAQKYLDVAAVMMVAIDTEQRVGLINRKGCEILGYSENEILGKNWFDNFLPKEIRNNVREFFNMVLSGQSDGPEYYENPVLTKNGEERLIAWHNTVLRDDKGKVIATLSSGEDITERRQTENKLLEDWIKLKSLASQLTLVEERERRRIAMALHDRISQSIVISKMKLDRLRNNFRSDDTVKVMNEVCNLLGEVIADIRSLTFELSSPILHELGFEAAVAAWLAEKIEKKHDIVVEFKEDKKPKPLDDDIKALLFRNVRELLINVVKHSRATKVKVSIQRVGDQINIDIEDNGIGFIPADVTAKAVRNGGFGLFSIQERLEELGGCLEIMSEPGHGCRVVMVAPLKCIEKIGG